MEPATDLANVWVTLNRDHVILDAGPGVMAMVAKAVGKPLFQEFPALEPKVTDFYAAAWENGDASALVEFPEGVLHEVWAHRSGPHELTLSWQTVTLPGLRERLERMEEAVRRACAAAAREAEPTGPQASRGAHASRRPALRVVG